MGRRRWVLGALAAAAVVLVAGRVLTALYVDHAWLTALGLPALARASLAGTLLVRGGTTLAATLFLFANLYVVRRSVVSLVLPRRVGDLEFGEEVPGRYLVAAAAAIAVLVGSFLGLSGDAWPHFVLAIEGARFGERDPYFERDLGFFVAWLPAELLLFAAAQRILVVTMILVAALYALTPSVRWRTRTLYVSEYVRRHLTVLGGVLLLLFAWAFRLEGFQLLMHGSGVGGAFAALDLQVRVPGTLVLSTTSLAAGLIVVWAGVAGQIRIAFLSVSVMLLLSIAVRYVLPLAMRPGSEAGRVEQPYLETREGFTRRAFGGDRVATLRADVMDTAMYLPSRESMSVWDPPALRRAIDGGSVVGWTRTNGALHAVVAQRGFFEGGDITPWTVARVAAWTSDAGGGPLMLPESTGASPDVLPPTILPDSAARYRLVADPRGVILGASAEGPLSRLVHAWALQNFRLVLGARPEPAPTIVLRPALRARVAAVVPFFVQGSATHVAVAGDTLFWTVELYVASSTYPLTEPQDLAGAERRYFHPAGHAIVNSATGRVQVAAVVDPEPPVRTWMDRFPELFVDVDALPTEMQQALVPHAEAARARALAFARLGPTPLDAPPARRHLAVEHGADTVVSEGLVPFALAGRPGLAIAIPVLDPNDRLAGIVVASGPSAVTRWIPASGAPRYWARILDALRAADSTAGRRDARVVRGPVRTLPLRGGTAFVQPTYLWPSRGEPALARVNIIVDSTAEWPGVGGAEHDGSADPSRATPADADARTLYLRMRDALRRGDWQAFGAAFEMLGRALAPGTAAPGEKLPGGAGLDSLRAPQP